jgi:hypothetical protein
VNAGKIIVGLIPFVVFSLLGNWLPVNWAAGAALIIGLVILLTNLKGGLKVVPFIQVLILAAVVVLGSLGNSRLNDFLTTYAHGIAPIILGVYILATVPVKPFTAQYARLAVAREVWDNPRFITVNRRLSAAWGVVVLALGVCHTIAALLVAAHAVSPIAAFAISWVVPVLAVVWALNLSRSAMARPVAN